MLSVGAATARATMNTELDNQFPVDAIAETWGSDNTIASDADVERTVRDLQAIDGINTVAYGRNVALASEFPGENSDGYPNRQVTAVNPDEFRAALRDPLWLRWSQKVRICLGHGMTPHTSRTPHRSGLLPRRMTPETSLPLRNSLATATRTV